MVYLSFVFSLISDVFLAF